MLKKRENDIVILLNRFPWNFYVWYRNIFLQLLFCEKQQSFILPTNIFVAGFIENWAFLSMNVHFSVEVLSF